MERRSTFEFGNHVVEMRGGSTEDRYGGQQGESPAPRLPQRCWNDISGEIEGSKHRIQTNVGPLYAVRCRGAEDHARHTADRHE